MVGSLGLALAWVPLARVWSQDTTAAGASAQEYEERYKQINGRVQDLLEAQGSLQKRIGKLAEEIQALREEHSRAANQSVRPEDLRKVADRLTEKIREIDQKREDDKKLILEEIRKLAQAPLPVPETQPKRPKEVDPPTAPATPQKGYEYVVKSGDTVAAIVAAYQQSGVKVSVSQVMKANPGLNANRLKVGQKVFIPDATAQ